MSTSSAYSKNKLQQILERRTQHFIIKSFLTSKFEYDRKVPEYYLYWFNMNKGPDPEHPYYQFLSHKKMNRREVRMFFDMIRDYNMSVSKDDGCVWEHKEIGFDKSKVKVHQTRLDLA